MRSVAMLVVALAIGAPVAAAAQSPSPVPAASASPVASASPAVALDPAIMARAKEWFHRFQVADIDRSQLTSAANSALTDTLVKQLATQIGPLGDPSEFGFVQKQTVGPDTIYLFLLKFKAGSVLYQFGLDATGKIAGLRLMPAG